MDNRPVVRLNNIEINNFKNVCHGEISFYTRRDYKSNILGLYGQNGSGKTALIDAIMLLKQSMMGGTLPAFLADYVNINSEYAELKYTFSVSTGLDGMIYEVMYSLCLKKDLQETETNAEKRTQNTYRATIFNEKLGYSYKPVDKRKKTETIMDTSTDNLFGPRRKAINLLGKDKGVETDLIAAKKLTAITSRSFIFSKEMMTALRELHASELPSECNLDYLIMETLVRYSHQYLFVVSTKMIGLNSLDALPLYYRYKRGEQDYGANLIISLNGPTPVPDNLYTILNDVINEMNIVLNSIIPKMKLKVEYLGDVIDNEGNRGKQIQIVSLKNGKEIPLSQESEGIRKIITVLHLLIAVYNDSSVTVAIDELDSGIFEYLLGELLKIIAENGKGQLIFTSHNLRPLETIDKGFVAFTTINPNNRYIRFVNVKATNNLRDFYYRDIVLGGQDDPVYDETNNYEIALAFREAGGKCES